MENRRYLNVYSGSTVTISSYVAKSCPNLSFLACVKAPSTIPPGSRGLDKLSISERYEGRGNNNNDDTIRTSVAIHTILLNGISLRARYGKTVRALPTSLTSDVAVTP